MPLDAAKERATQLESEVTSLERYASTLQQLQLPTIIVDSESCGRFYFLLLNLYISFVKLVDLRSKIIPPAFLKDYEVDYIYQEIFSRIPRYISFGSLSQEQSRLDVVIRNEPSYF